MKLRYKLFLTLFLVLFTLLGTVYAGLTVYQSRESRSQADHLFDNALTGLAELQMRQEESLQFILDLLVAQQSARPGSLIESSHASKIDLLFQLGADGKVRANNFQGELWRPEEFNDALESVFFERGKLKRTMGWLATRGKLYQVAIAPLQTPGGGWIGTGLLFPFSNYLRGSAGLEVALSGKDGRWSASAIPLSDDDTVILSNLNEDGTDRVYLKNGTYVARVVTLDKDVPGMRLALLLPNDSYAKGLHSLNRLFLVMAVALFACTIIISVLLSTWIATPLARVTNAVKLMTTGGGGTVPVVIPSSRDEIGEVAASFNQIARSLFDELKQKEKAFNKLERFQTQLLDLNRVLTQKLYENRVMLTLWKEQSRSNDTKEFLTKLLEELLQGLPFEYGCIIIRPLAQIGPEVILARMERSQGKKDVAVTDVFERADRTLWLTSLSPELKDFLLRKNDQSSNHLELLHEVLNAGVEPGDPSKELKIVSLGLAQGNQHLGSLHLISDKEKFELADSDEEFLSNVASQVSVLLENRSLQYSTRVDSLTRLYNRGYMMDRLREEMMRTTRSQRPFSLLLLDVDHFKKVNDTFGHQAGDDILVGLSALLKRTCRASDAICRYGGEEIAIILADTALTGAKVFAENLRKSIEGERFLISEGKLLSITASMGIAEFPTQGGSVEELIKHADSALYAAKKAGRNAWRASEVNSKATTAS